MNETDFFLGSAFIFNAIIVWIILAFIVGAYSSKKGGSFFAGFCFSILLSPLLAALIIAVRSPMTEEIEKRELETGTVKKCPHCAELIKREATKCRYCGESVPVPQVDIFAGVRNAKHFRQLLAKSDMSVNAFKQLPIYEQNLDKIPWLEEL